ncbi:MAG: hypothetical protein ACE5JH_07415 [Acidobacteriota bacterium]
MMVPPRDRPGRATGRRARYPAIARACFHLNWAFLILWTAYLAGPDVLAIVRLPTEALAYRLFYGAFFASHFVLMSVGIIALFVVIIEIHARRPVIGFRSVLIALTLPVVSFLYFASRFLLEVRRWLER